MFVDSTEKIVCYSCVESGVGVVCHDVDKEVVHKSHYTQARSFDCTLFRSLQRRAGRMTGGLWSRGRSIDRNFGTRGFRKIDICGGFGGDGSGGDEFDVIFLRGSCTGCGLNRFFW